MSPLADQLADANASECNEILGDLVDEFGPGRATAMWSDANAEVDAWASANHELNALATAALARLGLAGA